MKPVIADRDLFFDAEGNVTTDEGSANRWLARKGAAVLDEFQDAYKTFTETNPLESSEETADEESAKATAPAKNKSAKPAENKGGRA